MYSITEENLFSVAQEVFPLCMAHYDEVEEKSSTIKPNFNWASLKAMFDSGLVSLVVARKDGEVVGYYANLVAEDFITSTLGAQEIGIYLHPDHRGGRLFVRMLNFVEALLRERGVVSQLITFKAGHNTDLPLRLGFTHTETTYQKLLR